MRGRVERLIQHEAKPNAVLASRHPPSAVFFIYTSKAVLYVVYCTWYIVLPGRLAQSNFL